MESKEPARLRRVIPECFYRESHWIHQAHSSLAMTFKFLLFYDNHPSYFVYFEIFV